MLYLPYDDEYRKSLSTNKVNVYRKELLLNWLYEFKFTDYSTAFRIVGLNKSKGGYRFVRKLVEKGYLTHFHNVQLSDRVNLITLTPKGVKYLKSKELICSETQYINLKRLKNNSGMYHHLGTQKSVLNEVQHKYKYWMESIVSWEVKKGNIRIDALILQKPTEEEISICESWTEPPPKEETVAIEYERTSKSSKRIYYVIAQHDINITNGLYDQVIYYFDDASIKNLYEDKFAKLYWPRYKMNKSHRLEKLKAGYKPKNRNLIMFKFLNID